MILGYRNYDKTIIRHLVHHGVISIDLGIQCSLGTCTNRRAFHRDNQAGGTDRAALRALPHVQVFPTLIIFTSPIHLSRFTLHHGVLWQWTSLSYLRVLHERSGYFHCVSISSAVGCPSESFLLLCNVLIIHSMISQHTKHSCFRVHGIHLPVLDLNIMILMYFRST